MSNINMIMFKINKMRYKKNEEYKRNNEKTDRNQKIYCVFPPYDSRKKIQNAEFILKLGGETQDDPYYLDIELDAKFKVEMDISKEDLRSIIVEEKAYEIVIPYMRTRLLELTMFTETQYPYDIIYNNLDIIVIEKKEGIIDKIKRIISLMR